MFLLVFMKYIQYEVTFIREIISSTELVQAMFYHKGSTWPNLASEVKWICKDMTTIEFFNFMLRRNVLLHFDFMQFS